MLMANTVLGGRYEIIEVIGSGGMADVYKAVDHKLNRPVAIKVLKKEYASDQNFVSKFRAEAQAAAGLMHPNIVNVYDVGEEQGLYYFVMELVEGITLKHYIEKKIRLTVKEAVSIAIQVAMGIEAAHNNGIIHRDIKPQNIMISKEGKVKVADFGIAKAVSSDTITSQAMGSVHYTSPEQARGGYSDAKSDIYSIGISLFEMVTGHVPFDGETTVAIAIKHIQTEMPSPRIYVPDIPVSVEKIILKCTQKNADRRYANTTELIADLKRSLMNPDEDFVVMNNPASSEGTKAISDDDRRNIRSQTSVVSGPTYGNIIPNYQDDVRVDAPVRGGYQEDPYNAQGQYAQYDQSGMYGQNNQYGQYAQTGGYEDEEFDDMFEARRPSRNSQNSRVREIDEDYETPRKSSRKDSTSGKKKNDNSGRRGYEADERYARKESRRRDDYYEDELEDDVDPKMQRVITIIMVIVAIILTIGIILGVKWAIGSFSGSSDEYEITTSSESVTVPNVVGKSVDEASQILTEAGLTAKATKQESTEYDANYIISQDIEAGQKVSSGTVLNLVVSSGKVVGVNVPDVVGRSEAEAKVALEAEGFVMQKQLQESATVQKGNVISQSPLGATSAPTGSSVTVVISSGQGEADTVQVPDLVGKDEATAKSLLEAAGLKYSTVTEEYNDAVEAGKVLSQSYAAGEMAPKGSTVDFKISLGPESASYMCNAVIAAPATYYAGSEAVIILMSNAGAEIARYSVTSFPYTVNQGGIQNVNSGYITVTYLDTAGAWQTTSPVAVNFTKE